jgi:hypothetical protein
VLVEHLRKGRVFAGMNAGKALLFAGVPRHTSSVGSCGPSVDARHAKHDCSTYAARSIGLSHRRRLADPLRPGTHRGSLSSS